MKKTIIKNWIRYSASTLAISGMLVMGACGDSNETAEIETAETEVVREDVAVVEPEVQEVEPEEEVVPEQEQVAVRTDQGSDDFSATYINNMDAFLEEHKEVNQQITAALIDADSNLDESSTPETMSE